MVKVSGLNSWGSNSVCAAFWFWAFFVVYLVRAQLAKAVDGGALAGASMLPTGESSAQTAAQEFAQMNFPPGFMNTSSHAFNVTFDLDPTKSRIRVDGVADMPTTFMQLVGIDKVRVPAHAEAERRPLSVALVLDNSYSMHPNYAGVDAISYLRSSGADFVEHFDDVMDQMSLVLFSTGTEVRFPLGHDFSTSMAGTIRDMRAISNTNLADAFEAGHAELIGDPNMASYRALVFFTDGRPTTLRDIFTIDGRTYDAVMKCSQDPSGGVNDDLWRPDRLNEKIAGILYTSATLENGWPRTSANMQALANQNLLNYANQARDAGIAVYAIGLGNPNVAEWWKQPDPNLLIAMANVPDAIDPRSGDAILNGSYDPNQPEGGFYFAPDPTQLNAVFDQVAREIVLRLTQ